MTMLVTMALFERDSSAVARDEPLNATFSCLVPCVEHKCGLSLDIFRGLTQVWIYYLRCAV